jgi:hypothetical protein
MLCLLSGHGQGNMTFSWSGQPRIVTSNQPGDSVTGSIGTVFIHLTYLSYKYCIIFVMYRHCRLHGCFYLRPCSCPTSKLTIQKVFSTCIFILLLYIYCCCCSRSCCLLTSNFQLDYFLLDISHSFLQRWAPFSRFRDCEREAKK